MLETLGAIRNWHRKDAVGSLKMTASVSLMYTNPDIFDAIDSERCLACAVVQTSMLHVS
jgi:hypothetical protein